MTLKAHGKERSKIKGGSGGRPTKMILIFYLKEKLKWPHPKEISV
jgi:hypothetical protein